jgi:ABC-2 type transport system ATP-binding protein
MLALDRVSKHYGDVVALDHASFQVQRGRILGFLGPNGAGKTTAMRGIFGLVEPESGTITWDGKPITHEMRVRFGYMPEERGLYPKMRVREQLVHFARLSGVGDDSGEAADRWLSRLGLTDRADAKVEALSHGNQQRVQLAVALVHDPELLVLDEPFSGLDPLGAEALGQVLHELADGGVAIVFSSHQLDLVEDVCEDVAIIDHGRVVLTGDLDELRANARSRRLEVTVNGLPWAPEIDGVHLVTDDGKPHYVVDTDADLASLLEAAAGAGKVDRFTFEPPRLSDLFREAVRA